MTHSDDAPDTRPSVERLEATHSFPGTYRIKAIGRTDDGFADRAVAEARAELPGPDAVEFRLLPTPGGRHVSVTLELRVETAEEVRAVYGRLLRLEGLVLLL
jgi:putative lipoic acid-binding regulatory protein